MTILSDFIRQTHDGERSGLSQSCRMLQQKLKDVIITANRNTYSKYRKKNKKKTSKYTRAQLHTLLIQITNPIRLKGIKPPKKKPH